MTPTKYCTAKKPSQSTFLCICTVKKLIEFASKEEGAQNICKTYLAYSKVANKTGGNLILLGNFFKIHTSKIF